MNAELQHICHLKIQKQKAVQIVFSVMVFKLLMTSKLCTCSNTNLFQCQFCNFFSATDNRHLCTLYYSYIVITQFIQTTKTDQQSSNAAYNELTTRQTGYCFTGNRTIRLSGSGVYNFIPILTGLKPENELPTNNCSANLLRVLSSSTTDIVLI